MLDCVQKPVFKQKFPSFPSKIIAAIMKELCRHSSIIVDLCMSLRSGPIHFLERVNNDILKGERGLHVGFCGFPTLSEQERKGSSSR